jgi:hypothetical protein
MAQETNNRLHVPTPCFPELSLTASECFPARVRLYGAFTPGASDGSEMLSYQIATKQLLCLFFGGHTPRLGPAPQGGFLALRNGKS